MPVDPAEATRPEPFECCTKCGRGDVSSGFALRGELEFMLFAWQDLFGVDFDTAKRFVEGWVVREFGPDVRPVGELTITARLCSACAERWDIPTADLDLDELPGFSQESYEARLGEWST